MKRRDANELKRLGVNLIDKAGGAVQICKEADQVFEMYSGQYSGIFTEEESARFPILSRIGLVRGIWFQNPTYVSVRYGNHMDGAFIVIVRKGDESAARLRKTWIEIVTDRIYIHQ